jgi:hypothetical protein
MVGRLNGRITENDEPVDISRVGFEIFPMNATLASSTTYPYGGFAAMSNIGGGYYNTGPLPWVVSDFHHRHSRQAQDYARQY